VSGKNLFVLSAVMLALSACGGGDAESERAALFASPADGDTVSSPVAVEMAAEGFEVAPAEGSTEGQGHFHVMVDTDCVGEGETIPNDETHVHFGDGSTTTELELEPGEHTLCLQAGDQVHNAFGGTDEITITVE
jgi:hypothetical protein